MLTTAFATVGSGRPWVPHGDKASQPRPEQWLNVMHGNRGPWVPHVSSSSLLKLHRLTGARCFTATGATGCGICREWVTTFCWFFFGFVASIDLPTPRTFLSLYSVFSAYSHVRTEPLARHRPHSRKKKTTFCWFHHLGNKWMALFFAQDPSHFASEGCRVIN